jgi:hypothetical protein
VGKIDRLLIPLSYAGMEPSHPPDRVPPNPHLEFEQSLQAVERSLQDLKERHLQIQRDQSQQAVLETRLQQLQGQPNQGKSSELQVELRKIEQQLEELEVSLESRLFSWAGFKEVFWQAARFGGLGIVVGWSLAFYSFKNLPPAPSTFQPSSTSQPIPPSP